MLTGSTEFDSERVVAYALGYRAQLGARASVDWTAFSNEYDGIRGFVQGTPRLAAAPAPLHLLLPLDIGNGLSGRVHGTELAVELRAAPWWRLQAHAGAQWLRFHSDLGPDDRLAGVAPRHTRSLRSIMNLVETMELDLWLRHVDALPSPFVPAYTTLDVRFGWKPRRDLEISLVGQNLLRGRHLEFYSDFIGSVTNQVPREAYLKSDWRF